MTELKKIVLNYSQDVVLLGGGEADEETQNIKLEEMRVSLENLIRKENRKIYRMLVIYVVLILAAIALFFIFRKSEINSLTSFFTITGLSPLAVFQSMKQVKQKINASIVLEMVNNLNKETLNPVLSVVLSSIK
ncbi:MAG: hypothetical protein LBJ63_07470 [Prevotellaceae bacterium]|jgi:hypothetical protein|nr:hypothetical protein [Prevotellaceae bacterium]